MIETQIDPSKKLTIFTVSGTVTAREFAGAIRSFYSGNATLYSLWDLRKGDVELTENELWNIARSVRTFNLSIRTAGKTAMVTEEGTPFGLARMYQLIADSMTLPFAVKAFTDMEEARHWLAGEEAPTS